MPDAYRVAPYSNGMEQLTPYVQARDFCVVSPTGRRFPEKTRLDFVAATDLAEELNAALCGKPR